MVNNEHTATAFLIAGGSLHTPSTFSTKNSASLSALMSVEADAGLRHATRLMKTNRQS